MGAVELHFGFVPPPGSILPAPNPAAQPVRDDPAILEDLTVRPSSFAVGSSSTPVGAVARGTRISYRLNEPATVTLRIERAARGRRSGRRCVRPTRRLRRARRCIRYLTIGALRRSSAAGRTDVRFTGRIAGGRCVPASIASSPSPSTRATTGRSRRAPASGSYAPRAGVRARR